MSSSRFASSKGLSKAENQTSTTWVKPFNFGHLTFPDDRVHSFQQGAEEPVKIELLEQTKLFLEALGFSVSKFDGICYSMGVETVKSSILTENKEEMDVEFEDD